MFVENSPSCLRYLKSTLTMLLIVFMGSCVQPKTRKVTPDVDRSAAPQTPTQTPSQISSVTFSSSYSSSAKRNRISFHLQVDFASGNLIVFEGYPTCRNRATKEKVYNLDRSDSAFTYDVTPLPGTKTVCMQLEDAEGLRSEITADGEGTEGVDRLTFELLPSSPPTIQRMDVEHASTPGSRMLPLGTSGKLMWEASSELGFDGQVITKMEYSTNGQVWQPLQANLASTVKKDKVVSGTLTGWASPTSSPYVIRVYVSDVNGNRVYQTSQLLNDSKWSLFAGSPYQIEGNSPLAHMIADQGNNDGHSHLLVSIVDGQIYYLNRGIGLMRIRRDTYTSEVVLRTSDKPAGSNELGLFIDQDSLGYIYIGLKDKIYRFHPSDSKTELEIYFANGAEPTNGHPDGGECQYKIDSSFALDKQDNLYFLGGMIDSQQSRCVIKIHRQGEDAGSLEHIAGDGYLNVVTPGANARESSLRIIYWGISSLAVNADGSVVYVVPTNSNTSIPPLKIVKGKIYPAPTLKWGAITFDRWGEEGYFYNANYAFSEMEHQKIVRFLPKLSEENEEIEVVVGGGDDVMSCGISGKEVMQSCPVAGKGLAVDLYGRLYYIDGHKFSAPGQLRVMSVFKGKTEVIAGVLGLRGLGHTRTVAQFAIPQSFALHSNGDLYLGDQRGMQIVKFPANSNKMELVLGSGFLFHNTEVGEPREGQGLGLPYTGGNAGTVAIDGRDRIYFRSDSRLLYLDDEDMVQSLGDLSDTRRWSQSYAQAQPFSGYLWPYLGLFNFEFDSSHRMYFRAYYRGSAQDFPAILRVDPEDSSLTVVAGKQDLGDSNQSTADGELAASSTIKCSAEGTWEASDTYSCSRSAGFRVKNNTLYFGEVDRIRTVDLSTGLLGTLSDANAPVLFAAHLSVGQFIIHGDFLFYKAYALSSQQTDNNYKENLYCHWLGVGAAPDFCQDQPLLPPAVLLNIMEGKWQLGAGSLLVRDNILLMVVNNMILQYHLP